MPKVELTAVSVLAGDVVSVRVAHTQGSKYQQMQVEVFDAGIPNPAPRLGLGTTPRQTGDGVFEVDIDTRHLSVGIYELALVRFHTPLAPNSQEQLDLLPKANFDRAVFEVVAPESPRRTTGEILEMVTAREAELETRFTSPFDVRKVKEGVTNECCVFVFIRDVLIGTRIRFGHYELVSTGTGLESMDALSFVNQFLRLRTRTGIRFEYDDALRQRSQQSNPVCVVHFPNIAANTLEDARDYCVAQSNLLLLALALSRDASGHVFEIVVVDRHGGNALKYSISAHYVGNYLTGHISGESPVALQAYLEGMQDNTLSRFLVELYKEARRERHIDFQYVRFWQILEILAENRNYDPRAPLLDYEGNAVMQDGQPLLAKGSVNTVFSLLRDSGVGSTKSTWQNVNVWFALRSAVAHHGAVSRFEQLDREKVKEWARIAVQEVSETPGHDRFLWELKEDVKLLLMRRLSMGEGIPDPVSGPN